MNSSHQPLIRKVDCVRLFVSDLEAGLAFYRDQFGHELIWRTERAAGLRMPDTNAEIVLQTEEQRQEIDFTVESTDTCSDLISSGVLLDYIPRFRLGLCENRGAVLLTLFENVLGLRLLATFGEVFYSLPRRLFLTYIFLKGNVVQLRSFLSREAYGTLVSLAPSWCPVTHMATASFTPVGNSADSPESILSPWPATDYEAEKIEV
jgi:hypothetical protein